MSDEITNDEVTRDAPRSADPETGTGARNEAMTRRQVLTHAVQRLGGAGMLLLLPMAHHSAVADAAHKKPAAKKPAPKKAAAAKPAPKKPADAGPDTTGWTVLGDAAKFTQGQPQRVALDSGAVLYVTRLTATTFSAVSAKCTHRGCEVAWKQDAGQLVCPCHGAAFESGGKNIHGTSRQPDEALPALASLPTVQKKDQVLANLKTVPAPDLVPGH